MSILGLLYYYSFIIQNKSLGPIGVLIISIMFVWAFKSISKLDYQNQKEMKWNYNTWGRGAGAELYILKSLNELSGYKIIPDFNTGRGNIDFIVIGSNGIFIIEIKSSKGIISYVNEQLIVNRKIPEKDYIAQTVAEKLKLSDILKKHFNKHFYVTGLLEFPFGSIDRNSIHGKLYNHDIWIGQKNFHRYLIENSKEYLSQPEIEEIYTYLNAAKNGINPN